MRLTSCRPEYFIKGLVELACWYLFGNSLNLLVLIGYVQWARVFARRPTKKYRSVGAGSVVQASDRPREPLTHPHH